MGFIQMQFLLNFLFLCFVWLLFCQQGLATAGGVGENPPTTDKTVASFEEVHSESAVCVCMVKDV